MNLGNAGQEQTKAAAVKATPVIQVTELVGCDGQQHLCDELQWYDETI
ncbi:hypothetical protein [Vibrio lentus]